MSQPMFVIHVGSGTVEGSAPIKLVIWGFVGGPVAGDNPSKKHTPFAIRIESHNLSAEDVEPHWNYTLHPSTRTTIQQVVEEYNVATERARMEARGFRAADSFR